MVDKDEVPPIDRAEEEEEAHGQAGGAMEEIRRMFSEMQDRLEAIQDRLEAQSTESEKHLRDSFLSDQKQGRWHRTFVLVVAIAVVVGFAGLAYHLMQRLEAGAFDNIPPSVLMVMVMTPLISITTITVFLLVGMFRGFRHLKNPLPNLTTEVARQYFGN